MTNMNNEIKSVIVLIDPIRDNQLALDRAITQHDVNERDVHVHLFIGTENESLYGSDQMFQVCRDENWIASLTAPLQERNITYTIDLCWTADWQDSVTRCAEKYDAERIIVSDYSRDTKTTSLSLSKKALLRTSPCPVLIVHPEASKRRKTVVAALNMQTNDPRYIELNEKVLKTCWDMEKTYKSDLYVVNAYSDSADFPDRSVTLRKTKVDQKHLHVEQGNPEKIIEKFAEKVSADIVIIGTLARKGLAASFKGNKSEAIIKSLTCDVLVVN